MLIKNASAKQIILKPSTGRFFWRVDILRINAKTQNFRLTDSQNWSGRGTKSENHQKRKNWDIEMLIKNASAKQIILKPSRFFWRVDILRNATSDRFMQFLVQISKWIGLKPTVRRSLLLSL